MRATPEASLLDIASHIKFLKDTYKVERFVSLGHSGGQGSSAYSQQPPAEELPTSKSAGDLRAEPGSESPLPLATTFPEDEPIFASPAALSEPLHEQHDDLLGLGSRPGQAGRLLQHEHLCDRSHRNAGLLAERAGFAAARAPARRRSRASSSRSSR